MRYSPLIVEHFTNPVLAGVIDDAEIRAFVGNPVCGDQVLLTASVDGSGVITDARFLAYGCAASLATASILATSLPGRRPEDLARTTDADVVQMVGGLAPDQRHCAELGTAVLHRVADNAATGVKDEGPGVPCEPGA